MATNTSKYLLKKPAYSDTADIGDINDNMDSIDSVLFDHAGSIAVICMGNVCAVSVSTGKYVLLQKSTIAGRTDGLYTAAKAIPANTVIDSSYLTAVSGGGLNDVYTALNDRFMILNSGSLHDITQTGIYYLTSNVTDKPIGIGGLFILSFYNNLLRVGKYISMEGDEFNVISNGGTWTYSPCNIKYVTVSGTTTSSGAIMVPTANQSSFYINGYITSGGPGFVIRRDNGYFTVFKNDGTPMTNTAVTFTAAFV